MKSKFDLSGRTAVVTGAGQGLGKSFARSLSLAGAEVFMMARNLERLENTSRFIQEESGNTIHVWPLDITDEQSVKEACRFVMQSAGHLDILVNNAAVGRSDTPLVHESLKEWSRILETNLTGTFLMMKHVGKIMEAQKYGKIINLASVTGKVAMRNPTIGAYDVSKAGVECLTRLMAGVWAEHNINVNAICPGYYMTEINEKYVKENPGFYKGFFLDCIPLKTWGKPEDIRGYRCISGITGVRLYDRSYTGYRRGIHGLVGGEHIMRVEGKIIAVTGAGSGIGKASAQFLLRRERPFCSWRDELKGRKEEQDIKAAGGRAELYLLDISDWDAVQKVFGSIKEEYGGLMSCIIMHPCSGENLTKASIVWR